MTDITNNKPTESELDILRILWEKGSATVREVHEILELNKETGYTTTLKQMQIMHERSFVSRDTSSKVHIYKPAIKQEKVQEQVLDRIINSVYSGSPAKLVMQALGNYSASKEEMDLIRNFINKLKK